MLTFDENFDADDILRDVDEQYIEEEEKSEEVRELNFGNDFDEKENYRDVDLGDLDE